MARLTRKQLKQDEFVDAAFSVEQWIEQHWVTALKWVGAVAVLAVLAGGWLWWSGRRAEQAQQLLGEALDQYRLALQGDPQAAFDRALTLFEESVDKAGDSPVGHVATYYRGATLIRMNRPEEALPWLERAAATPTETVATVARAMLAEVYTGLGRTDDAIDTLRRLGDRDDPYGEQALLQLGMILEQRGDAEGARRTLEQLLERNPSPVIARRASQLLSRLPG